MVGRLMGRRVRNRLRLTAGVMARHGYLKAGPPQPTTAYPRTCAGHLPVRWSGTVGRVGPTDQLSSRTVRSLLWWASCPSA
jgi:hypothetical protein